MSQAEPVPASRPTRILLAADTLFADGHDAPEPLPDASTAIERLGWIGQPVVVVGDHLAGRRLPCDEAERLAWVRGRLGAPDLAAVVFDEPTGDPVGDVSTRAATEGWSALRDTWQADTLVTGDQGSVGPARRAGLTVIRVRGRLAAGPSIERADHEARDLLDAVTGLMTAHAFRVEAER